MLNEINLDVNFINSLNVTSARHILLSTTNQLYLLGWGGIEPIGRKYSDTINSFAYTTDGFLLLTHNNELCYIDTLNNLIKLYELPNRDMGIAAGNNVMYMYDRDMKQKTHALYILFKGHKYTELFFLQTPINAVFEMKESLLFATDSNLLSYNSKNKKIKIIATTPKQSKILSIAGDTANDRIYFSTYSTIYTIKDSISSIITERFGGNLQFFNKGLIVFNPEKKYLKRVVGLEESIKSEIPSQKYYIIIGSYSTLQEANDAVITMKTKGNATAEVVGKNDDGNWRVSYKSFLTKEEADQFLAQVKQFNPSAWIFLK
jgi:hypothetical protein